MSSIRIVYSVTLDAMIQNNVWWSLLWAVLMTHKVLEKLAYE